jgi:hypothetical protein
MGVGAFRSSRRLDPGRAVFAHAGDGELDIVAETTNPPAPNGLRRFVIRRPGIRRFPPVRGTA